VCAHVTAATIAWNHERTSGPYRPPPSESIPHVGYRFRREKNDELSLDRVIVTGETEEPLAPSLVACEEPAPRDAPSRPRARRDSPLPPGHDAAAPDRRQDASISCATFPTCSSTGNRSAQEARPSCPSGRVEDDGVGIQGARGARPRDPGSFRNGIVRCGDELRAVSDGSLSPEQRTISVAASRSSRARSASSSPR
jgi:hypothetical protein